LGSSLSNSPLIEISPKTVDSLGQVAWMERIILLNQSIRIGVRRLNGKEKGLLDSLAVLADIPVDAMDLENHRQANWGSTWGGFYNRGNRLERYDHRCDCRHPADHPGINADDAINLLGRFN
jgi:hypothetical protein